MSQEETSALADGLFWYAEKLRFGYEDIQPNQAEALRIYKQAASLSHGKANLRLGEMYEQGIGIERDPVLALARYTTAWKIGAPEGLAGIGGLLFRSGRFNEGNRYWSAFFERISQEEIPESWTDDRVTWVHRYLLLCLTHNQAPHAYPALRYYRSVLLSYHQLSIEHAQDEQQLDSLSRVADWLAKHL
jgi:TPR repeat protein